jgi:hypothetical protein
MKKAIAAVVLFFAVSAAMASCPPSAPYRCSVWGGKTVCGCG